MKTVRPVIALNGVGVFYLQMSSVGSHSTSGREKKGKKERSGGYIVKFNMVLSELSAKTCFHIVMNYSDELKERKKERSDKNYN